MNILNVIKSAISYIFTFFAGVYGLCLFKGEIDFFMVFGFIACAIIAIITSPLLARFFKFEGRKWFLPLGLPGRLQNCNLLSIDILT